MNDLFIRYLNGTASDEELHTVLDYISQSPENAEELYAMRKLHYEIHDKQQFDYTKNFESIRNHISKPKKSSFQYFLFPLSVAAAFILIYVGYSLFFTAPHQSVEEIVQTTDSKLSLYLEDSSFVTMDLHSSIDLEEFSIKNRVIKLSGNAFFEVAKHPAQFTVHVQDVSVTAVGTAFSIYENNTNNYIRIHMQEGTVLVSDKKQTYTLSNQETITLYKQNDKLYVPIFGNDNTFYKDSIYSFTNTNLNKVVKSLNSRFNKQIVTDSSLNSIKINATFHVSDSLEIPHMLSLILNTDFCIKNDTVYFPK
ncbi:MAG: FecR domain-containing protein [Bacteroidota bacterium]